MVLLPLVRQFSRMLQRNIVYTAVTRAAEKLVLIGEPAAMVMATQHTGENRQTSLLQRLTTVWQRHDQLKSPLERPSEQPAATSTAADATSAAPVSAVPSSTAPQVDESDTSAAQPSAPAGPTVLTAAMIDAHEVDPLLGMVGITPYDC